LQKTAGPKKTRGP